MKLHSTASTPQFLFGTLEVLRPFCAACFSAMLILSNLWANSLLAEETSTEAKLVAKIEKLGGKVVREDDSKDGRVVEINFRGCKNLSNVSVGMLKSFPELTTLTLSGTKITDSGLKGLKGLDDLQTLELDGVKITDAGLRLIPSRKNLMVLNLDQSKVTDEGINELKSFRNLTELHLGFAPISNRSLKKLAELPHLAKLSLRGSRVTDEGMKEFQAFESLTHLDLSATQITDAGLADLHDHKTLTVLTVRFIDKISDVGLKELKATIPHLQIQR